MTTRITVDRCCTLCGETSSHGSLLSTNEFGYSDLDTRPAPMKRWTIDVWVQRCPSCGLCANDLENEQPGSVKELVASEAYQQKLTSSGLPALAASFACSAHLANARGNTIEAAWDLIQAAWACDDAADEPGADPTLALGAAKRCRELAVELLDAEAANPDFEEQQPGFSDALLADLARRQGRWDQATAFLERGKTRAKEPILLELLEVQRGLIAKLDSQCHTMELLPSSKSE